MRNDMKTALAEAVQTFRLPRYDQLPDMGLYLEQITKYINQCLAPLGCFEVTGSMIRNYVKMGLVNNPAHKMYYADQIAHLICVTILKTVLPLEHVSRMFTMQRKIYTDETAYDYFCMELENILHHRFGIKETLEDIGVTESMEKEMLRSAIISVSHIIYVDACFNWLGKEEQ